MYASRALLLIPLIFYITCLTAQKPSSSIILPVTKDVSTLQYTTQIFMGTPNLPTKLVLDLGGSSIWVDRASKSGSSSQSYIQSGSLPCSIAKAGDTTTTTSTKVNAHKSICDIYPENTITGTATSGYLAEDITTFDSHSILTSHHLLFSCTPSLLLKGLASGAKGMLGLGRSKLALTSQIANSFHSDRKFALCLSSSEGVVFAGGGGSVPYDISKSLVYTPLVSKQGDYFSDQEYYVNVKSIRINGKKLSLGQKGIGEAKLSTIVPYTTLGSPIYDTFTKAYIKAAASINMSRVESVAPFGVCFNSKWVDKSSQLGPVVPKIDLVLQSELVKWGIYGRNSMVEVNNEVMCLGFLDGGLTPKSPIVIGGHQLEDNLLEFNLGTSMLGFTHSVLMESNGCSSFRSASIFSGTM